MEGSEQGLSDASNNAEASTAWICVRERETVRSQIVLAAQDILSRKGPEAVTLGAVAKSTKIPRATVYSLFANRRDLMAALTAAPQAEIEALPQATPKQAPSLEAVPDAAEAPITAEPEKGITTEESAVAAPVEAMPLQAGNDEAPSGNAPSYDDLMREQAEALQALSRQVIVPNSRSTRDAALTRLDARIAVTEKSIAALEQHVGQRLKTLESDTDGLSQTLASLRGRLEKFEERQVTALAELRLDVHRLAKADKPAAIAEVFHDRLAPIPVAVEPAPVPESCAMQIEEAAGPREDDIVATDSDDADIPKMPTYLTSARLAAMKAAATAPTEPPRRRRPPFRRFLFKNRWVLLAAAGVLVVWFDVYVFAHYQPAAVGQRPVVLVAEKHTVTKQAWSPRAQLVRGLKYLNGTGVPVNVDSARVWLERAARAGNPVAENLVGVLCQTGTGMPTDINAARRWYEAAAAQGNLKAMTNLGKLYAGGWKDGTDYAKAAEWFSKAAAYGEVDAQFDLAVLYERGAGVARNPVEAYKWYMIAGKAGDNKAAVRASTLAAHLDPDSLSAADSAIAGFTPLRPNSAANDVPQLSG
jgi:TPR repeat protein